MEIGLRNLLKLLLITGGLALVLTLSPPANAQSATKGSMKEVYTGTILYIPGPTVGGPGRTRTTTNPFTLTITCTTPDEEVARLAGVLRSDGQDALLKALSKEKCGTMQIGGNIGRDVNGVRISTTEEGERKITLLFERWINFSEARYGTRSLDYPFAYVELFFDDNKKKGEGTMIPLAKIRFKDEKTVEIENFAAYPARLLEVRRSK